MSQQLIFSVTNDLSYDQRMIRICTSLSVAGYKVTLVGRLLPGSLPLKNQPFRQHRLKCLFRKGLMFYAEFNTRLFFYLLFHRASLLCAIDLDTIVPVCLVSGLKNIPRVYDAHELFCEMKEVVTRPRVYRFWKGIEKWLLPKFGHGYTVNDFIAGEFERQYGLKYQTIRNLPVLIPNLRFDLPAQNTILYQGAVNEARCFEALIPAMKNVDGTLIICGEGNFMNQAKKLVSDNNLGQKVIFKGWLEPEVLRSYTLSATVGVNIIEDNGLNNRFSLSNRFFDYIQSALPQVCVGYPAYKQINDEYHCALLINDTSASSIASAINRLLHDKPLYTQLKQNCFTARERLNWNNEERKLVGFYQNILPT